MAAPWRFGLLALALTFALLWPAVANRAPILFSDSIGYFRAGEASLDTVEHAVAAFAAAERPGAARPSRPVVRIDTEADGTSTQRSVYYGVLLAQLYRMGGTWVVAALQAASVAVTLLLAFGRLGVRDVRRQALLGLGLAAVSGLAVFSSAMMPDIYLGLMLLSISLLFAYDEEMPFAERGWFCLMVLAAVLFHRAHLTIAVVLILASGAGLALLHRRWLRTSIVLAAICAIGWAGHQTADLVVLRVTGQRPIATPFLLARVVGDGTALRYLDRHCATKAFVTCRYRSHMPMSENTFLWSHDPRRGAYGAASREERAAFSAEEKTIVFGTVKEFPADQFLASFRNVVRQLGAVGATEFEARGFPAGGHSGFEPALRAYRNSALAKGTMPLGLLSTLMRIAYFAGLAGIAVLAARQWGGRARSGPRRDSPDSRFWIATAVVVLGLVVNAAVSGAIAGVFDRYQGRAAWLVALLAGVMVLTRGRQAVKADGALTQKPTT